MKAQLPIIGLVKTGKDAEEDVESLIAATIDKLTISDSGTLGGIVETKSTLSGEKTISTKLLAANTGWVYRNNDVIAKEVATLEFELYRIDLKQGEVQFTEIDSHPILDLLARINDSTTQSDALYNTQSHKKLTGDAFWLLDGKGANLKNVFLLQPDKIELGIGDPTDATASLIQGYKYKDTIDGKEIEKYYLPDEILHFKTPNPNNMFRGYGAVEALAEDIDLDNLTTEVNKKFFQNGAIISYILSTVNKVTDDQLKRLRAEFRAAFTGTKNAHKVPILGGGLEPKSVSMSNKEMEFLAQLEWYRDKIMVGFGNTKAALGIIEDVNRASHESSIISWKRNSVKPEMQAIVNTLNEFLVPRYGERLVLGFKDPVPEDRESKLLEIEKAKGVTSVNERRDLLGYDGVGPEGDKIPELESERRSEEMAQAFRNQPEVPKSLQNVDLKKMLRRYKVPELIEEYKNIKEASHRLAKQIIARRKGAKPIIIQEHDQFTNDEILEYWAKQIRVVEVIEARFKNTLVQFIDELEKDAQGNLEAEIAAKKSKALLNKKNRVSDAYKTFGPILIEQATISGQQALRLIKSDDPYIPFGVRPKIEENVRKFATSMLETQIDQLSGILADGIKEGKSVPQIRDDITDAFDGYRKGQAERITRTEVLRVSNEASVDAWDQSGVVEGKQWLTAEDDRVDEECASYNGKILDLDGAYTKTDYGPVEEPPLHPNCRCVVLPVLERSKAFNPAPIDERELLKARVSELEAKVDKRTKEYKEIKKLRADDQAYIKAMEGLIDG